MTDQRMKGRGPAEPHPAGAARTPAKPHPAGLDRTPAKPHPAGAAPSPAKPSTLSGDPVRARLNPDAVIMRLAARQHGVVTREQLVRAGLASHRIDYRVLRGRLQPLLRGVYRVGPVVAPREREIAAVLACGGGAVVSHRSAAAMWKLIPAAAATAPVDVSIASGCRAARAGMRVHRVTSLRADEVTVLEGVPVTTAARTLLDLASCADPRELERALAHADRHSLAGREQIEEQLARYPRRSGMRRLRLHLGEAAAPAFVRSEAEARFLELIGRAQLPAPETNVQLSGYEVDFLWRRERLVAEMDGVAYHSSNGSFERDRRRDGVLTAGGFRVMRFTWRQLTTGPEALLVSLAQALARTISA